MLALAVASTCYYAACVWSHLLAEATLSSQERKQSWQHSNAIAPDVFFPHIYSVYVRSHSVGDADVKDP